MALPRIWRHDIKPVYHRNWHRLEIELPWTKVQRRLAQLINENNFLSEQEALPLRYQVVIYHHLENGFDEKLEYRALQEAEKVAQGYVDGTLEAGRLCLRWRSHL